MKKTYIFDVAFVKKENNDDPFEEKPRNNFSNDIVIISGHSLIEKKYFNGKKIFYLDYPEINVYEPHLNKNFIYDLGLHYFNQSTKLVVANKAQLKKNIKICALVNGVFLSQNDNIFGILDYFDIEEDNTQNFINYIKNDLGFGMNLNFSPLNPQQNFYQQNEKWRSTMEATNVLLFVIYLRYWLVVGYIDEYEFNTSIDNLESYVRERAEYKSSTIAFLDYWDVSKTYLNNIYDLNANKKGMI